MSFENLPDINLNNAGVGTTSTLTTTTTGEALKTETPKGSVFVSGSITNSTQSTIFTSTSSSSTTLTVKTPETGLTETTISTPTSSSTSPQSETEIDALVRELGLENKGNVDNIKRILLKKKATETLSVKEEHLLSLLSLNDKTDASTQEAEKPKLSQDAVEYTQIMLGDGTPYQKLTKGLDKFLAEDTKYTDLKTEKQKQQYRDTQIHDMVRQILPEYKNKGNIPLEKRRQAHTDMLTLLAYAQDHNLSIDDLKKMSSEQINQIISQSKIAATNAMIEAIPGFEKMHGMDQLKAMSNFILTTTDPKYNKLEGKAKDDYLENYIKNKAAKILGIGAQVDSIEFDKLAQVLQDFNFTDIQKYCINHHIGSIDAFMNLPVLEQNQAYIEIMKAKEKNGKLSKEDIAKIAYFETRTNIISDIQAKNAGKDVTDLDIYKELKNRTNLTEDEKKLLDELQLKKDGGVDLNKPAGLFSNFIVSNAFGLEKDGDYASHVLIAAQETGDPAAIQEARAFIGQMFATDGSIEAVDTLYNNILKYCNGDKELAKQIMKDCNIPVGEIFAHEGIYGTGKSAGKAQTYAMKYGTIEQKETARNITREVTRYMDKIEASDFGVVSTMNGLENEFNTGINTYKTQEEAAVIASNIVNSDQLSDSQRATYTKSLVITTDDDSRKLYYGQQLSQINNQAVAEGLAAASNTFSDSSLQGQYNGYIEESIRNFGYDAGVIHQAMNSGQISSATMNSTTPSAVSSSTYTSTPARTSATTSTQSSYSNSVATSQKTAVASLNNYSTGLKTNEPAAKIASTYLSYLNQVTKSLEEKRDKVGEKLDEIQTNIAKSQAAKELGVTVEELEDISQTYQGITEEIYNELVDAYKNGGMTDLYDKLTKVGSNAQRAFLVYFAQHGSAEDIRKFVEVHRNDLDIISVVLAHNNNISNLPSDLVATFLKKGTIDASQIGNIRSFASNYRNDRDVIEGLFLFTGDVSLLAYNYDLLRMYLAQGKVTIAQLKAAGIYQDYKNSLSAIEQQKLEEQAAKESIAYSSAADNIEVGTSAIFNPTPFVPGDDNFFAAQNTQALNYNLEDYNFNYNPTLFAENEQDNAAGGTVANWKWQRDKRGGYRA